MYAKSVNKSEVKKERKFLFDERDFITIPAKEGWNEGYAHTSKFLYINSVEKEKAEKIGILASVN